MKKNKNIIQGLKKILSKNKYKIPEIKKILSKKIFDLKKKDNSKENNLGSLTRTFLSSLIIMVIFFSIPIVLDFKEERKLLLKKKEGI